MGTRLLCSYGTLTARPCQASIKRFSGKLAGFGGEMDGITAEAYLSPDYRRFFAAFSPLDFPGNCGYSIERMFAETENSERVARPREVGQAEIDP